MNQNTFNQVSSEYMNHIEVADWQRLAIMDFSTEQELRAILDEMVRVNEEVEE